MPIARLSIVSLAALVCLFATLASQARGEASTREAYTASVCRMIDLNARARGLPPAFLARLIWRESRFDANARSPVGAMGIAQFMPGTAREWGLDDPYDPRRAIPASAAFLRRLHDRFGNLGLAAAAYNGGPNRVAAWLKGRARLPSETRDYVRIITREPVDHWRDRGAATPDLRLSPDLDFRRACEALPALLSAEKRIAPPAHPWRVQVAAHFDPGVAEASYRRVAARHPEIFAEGDMTVTRKRLRSRGARALHHVGLGAPSRAAAQDLCGRLRARGGTCTVARN